MNPRGRHRPPPESPPGRRLFIAVPVPPAVSDLVAGIVARLRAAEGEGEAMTTPGRQPHHVRWVRLDQLHLTVRFLGPTAEDRIDAAIDALSAAAAGQAPLRLGLRGAGAFPSLERPRALWLGIVDPEGGMAALARATSHALALAGWPPDDRPYAPHLTLARTDGVRSGPRVARRLVAAARDLDAWFDVDRLVLFESQTGRGPACYVPLRVAVLGPNPGDGERIAVGERLE